MKNITAPWHNSDACLAHDIVDLDFRLHVCTDRAHLSHATNIWLWETHSRHQRPCTLFGSWKWRDRRLCTRSRERESAIQLSELYRHTLFRPSTYHELRGLAQVNMCVGLNIERAWVFNQKMDYFQERSQEDRFPLPASR